MPASPLRQVQHDPGKPQRDTRKGVRVAKNATARRFSRKERARYRTLVQFSGALVCAVLLFMVYLGLNAHLTSLNYAFVKAESERAALQGQTARMDEQLAALRSDDRLAAIAAKLHMQEGQQFAIVELPSATQPARRTRVALLTSLAGFFGAK